MGISENLTVVLLCARSPGCAALWASLRVIVTQRCGSDHGVDEQNDRVRPVFTRLDQARSNFGERQLPNLHHGPQIPPELSGYYRSSC